MIRHILQIRMGDFSMRVIFQIGVNRWHIPVGVLVRDLLCKSWRGTANNTGILLQRAVSLATFGGLINIARYFHRAVRRLVTIATGCFALSFTPATWIGLPSVSSFLMPCEVASVPTSLQAVRIAYSASKNKPVIFNPFFFLSDTNLLQ